LFESATKANEPEGSIDIPIRLSKRATSPTPSAYDEVEDPAKLETKFVARLI
jgi:hypothetical protein